MDNPNGPRYWLLHALPNEDTSMHNRINEVHEAATWSATCGLVDEEAGGVIAYLIGNVAEEIVERLNRA